MLHLLKNGHKFLILLHFQLIGHFLIHLQVLAKTQGLFMKILQLLPLNFENLKYSNLDQRLKFNKFCATYTELLSYFRMKQLDPILSICQTK